MVKKKFIAAVVAGVFASSQVAFAGFKVLNEDTSSKPQDPVQIVTEAHENARLKKELERVSAELAQVRVDLESARDDAAQSRQALLTANAKLELLQTRIEKIAVSFASGHTEFSPLPDVAEKITANAKLAGTVNVRGYTDSVGSPTANERIALQRAIAAKKYLVNRGVEDAKVKVFGRAGEYVASNTTEAGRLANRRVEFEFLP